MGSKVLVAVAWGVECLFGADGRASEATWDSMNELQQQDYVRRIVSGERAIAEVEDGDEEDADSELDTEQVVSVAKGNVRK